MEKIRVNFSPMRILPALSVGKRIYCDIPGLQKYLVYICVVQAHTMALLRDATFSRNFVFSIIHKHALGRIDYCSCSLQFHEGSWRKLSNYTVLRENQASIRTSSANRSTLFGRWDKTDVGAGLFYKCACVCVCVRLVMHVRCTHIHVCVYVDND